MGIRESKKVQIKAIAKEVISEFLRDNNITMADIYDLKRLKKECEENNKSINDLKVEVKVVREKQIESEYKKYELTKQEKEKIEKASTSAVSMQDIVDSYKGDVQEFYPDGKRN